MTERANQRTAYFNGAFVPESEVKVSFRDRGFRYGDGVFDTTRSFAHRIFRLDAHIERLYRSLAYLGIDTGLSPAQMAAVTEQVFERNRHLLDEDEDYWVSQRISRGVDAPAGEPPSREGATVIVECSPLPLKARASLFRDGIRMRTSSIRRTPPESLSPRAKMNNYLNLVLADREVKGNDPEAWVLLLDIHGNVAEGMSSNFFIVREGRVLTPRARFVLGGISRDTVIALAREEGVPVEETDIDPYDVCVAEEAFVTSTSLAICPVASVNARTIGKKLPGPLTKRLTDAYIRLVGFDFVAQYLRRLDGR
jgi:branched-chain amino acid aminotransferase